MGQTSDRGAPAADRARPEERAADLSRTQPDASVDLAPMAVASAQAQSRQLSPFAVAQLQRHVGNAAVAELLKPPSVDGRSNLGVQRAPAEHQHPEDAAQVRVRLEQRIREGQREEESGRASEDGAERPSDPAAAARAVDRGKAASRASALENDARPDVDRVAETKPDIDQRSTEAQTEVDEPATPPGEHGEGEQTAAEGGAVDSAANAQAAGMGEDGGAGSAAQRAASLAEAAFGEAGGSAGLPSVPEVTQPAAIEAVDASGESIAPDAAANDDLADLTDQAQEMREHGAHLRGQAAEARNNAAILRGNLAVVRGGIAEADDGIGTAQVHSRERRSILGQAHQALAVSEQKAAEVAAKAPEFATKADDGKSESGPMVGEARQTAAENAAKTPEDPEAAGKSGEQGAKMDKVAADSATMDDAISQTKERAGTLEQEAAQAKERNAQTRERIGQGTQQLDQMDQHLARQKQETSRARGAAAAAAGHPAAIASRAGQLDERAAGDRQGVGRDGAADRDGAREPPGRTGVGPAASAHRGASPRRPARTARGRSRVRGTGGRRRHSRGPLVAHRRRPGICGAA